MFWNRKKDIVLDCYTSNPFAYNLARINYGYHFIPEWWKKTPKILEKRIATIKNYIVSFLLSEEHQRTISISQLITLFCLCDLFGSLECNKKLGNTTIAPSSNFAQKERVVSVIQLL